MQMREQDPREIPERNAELIQPHEYAAADIEDEFFGACLHQNAGPESIERWRWRTRSEQHDAEHRRLRSNRLEPARRKHDREQPGQSERQA